MRKLYRSSTDKKIAGVCGGLGEYLHVDPTIIRIVFFLLLLPGGLPGVIPYAILWIVVPIKPVSTASSSRDGVIDIDPSK